MGNKNPGAFELISDQYDVVKFLGQGEFGAVYQCTHRNSKMDYAVKLIPEKYMNFIQLEIEILKTLKHRNMLHLKEVILKNNWVFLVFELLIGGDLFERERTNKGPFSEENAKTVCLRVANFLSYIHEQHCIHRDIKLEHIMFLKENDYTEVRIIDFGIAKWVGGIDGTDAPETVSEAQKAMIADFSQEKKKKDKFIVGTLGYSAPEVLLEGKVGFAADMFSFGCLVFVMLTGEMPFDERTEKETRKHTLAVQYNIPKDVVLSPDAEDFIAKLLVYKPEARMTAHQCLEHPWLMNVQ